MPGHDVLAHLGGVAGEFPDIVDLADITATSTLDLQGKGIVRAKSTTSLNATLPDEGFIAILRHESGGNLVVKDTDTTTVATVAVNETAFCVRVGESTTNRWHAVVMKTGSTS
jgi:hypothetical protein